MFGVVHVLISGETIKHRLPQQTDQRMAAVLAVRASVSFSPAIPLNPSGHLFQP
jgi:hypothetical protein